MDTTSSQGRERGPGDAVAQWVAAGLLDEQQAEAIRDFERIRRSGGAPGVLDAGPETRATPAPAAGSPVTPAGSTAPATPPPTPSPTTRPPTSPPPAHLEVTTADAAADGAPARWGASPAEAIGYVGAALALGALGALLGEFWDGLLVGGRLALVVTLTVIAFGAAVASGGASHAALQRLSSVLATLGVAGVGWGTAVVAIDVVGLRDEAIGTVVGGAMLVIAIVVLSLRPRALPQLAVLGSLLLTVTSSFQLMPMPSGPEWIGVTIGGIGLVWGVLALGSWLAPRGLALAMAAVLLVVGPQVASFGDLRALALTVGVIVAGSLVAAAVRGDTFPVLVVASLGLFVLTPQLVIEWFGDTIGGPALLLLIGLLLVLLAVGLSRARREIDPVAHGGRGTTP